MEGTMKELYSILGVSADDVVADRNWSRGQWGHTGLATGIFGLTYQLFLTEMDSGFNRRKAVMRPSQIDTASAKIHHSGVRWATDDDLQDEGFSLRL
jgi:hypothetical protein